METLVDNKVDINQRKSLESWQIESQLAEIGVPYVPISWTDGFLMAENLQNYFAEVIAQFSHIKRKNGFENLELKEKRLQWIKLRNEYPFFAFSEKQQLLINLMTEHKYLSTLL
jgi:hypothetical protein